VHINGCEGKMNRQNTRFSGDAKSFDDALQQVRDKIDSREMNPAQLEACIRKLTTLVNNGPALAKRHPDLIEAVDGAIAVRYPHHKLWDNDMRSRLLTEQLEILYEIAQDGVVDLAELENTATFCRAMRDTLQHNIDHKVTSQKRR